MKLALNLVVVSSIAEALVLGKHSGLAGHRMLEVFRQSTVGSPLVQYKSAKLPALDPPAEFITSMTTKDLDAPSRPTPRCVVSCWPRPPVRAEANANSPRWHCCSSSCRSTPQRTPTHKR